MLYIDFALSVQAQKIVQGMGYASARVDLPNAEKPDQILYLTERPNYAAEYEHWSKLKVEVFGKATPPWRNPARFAPFPSGPPMLVSAALILPFCDRIKIRGGCRAWP